MTGRGEQQPLWEDEPDHVEGFTYDSPRDEVLHIMMQNGWAESSSGHPFAPTGHFARMSNTPLEIADLRGAFESTIVHYGIEPESVLGHFILVEEYDGDAGKLHVVEYQARLAMLAAYGELRMTYEAWREDNA